MKHLLFPFMIVFSCQLAVSQNWQLLGEDEIGDWQVTGAADFTSAYYAVDSDKDSLWFMFTFDITNWDIGGDFGLALGVDTNLVIDDGIDWGGLNQSMKTDIQYVFTRNGVFQSNIINNASNPLNADIYESATHDTLILRFPQNEFDSDGRFRVIAGVATFTLGVGGTVYEEIPSDGFFLVDLTISAIENPERKFPIKIYPNPATQMIWVEKQGYELKKVSLFDLTGTLVSVSTDDSISVTELIPGIYVMGIEMQQFPETICKKVIILNHD